MIRVAKVGFSEWNVDQKECYHAGNHSRDHRQLLDIILWGLNKSYPKWKCWYLKNLKFNVNSGS